MSDITINPVPTAEPLHEPTALERWLSAGKYVFWVIYAAGILLKIMSWPNARETLMAGLCGYGIYYVVLAKQLLQARSKKQTIISYGVGAAIAISFTGIFVRIDSLPFGTETLYLGLLLCGVAFISAVIGVLVFYKNAETARFSNIVARAMMGVFVFTALLPKLFFILLNLL
jgi:hypothetical protein